MFGYFLSGWALYSGMVWWGLLGDGDGDVSSTSYQIVHKYQLGDDGSMASFACSD